MSLTSRCSGILALCTLASAHFLSAQQLTITTFDPPGSTSTTPTGMNASGTIVGSYLDATSVSHGFVRTPDGTFQTYDAPGWGTSSSAAVVSTYITGIDDTGDVTGHYVDATNATFGFVQTTGAYNASWFSGVFPNGINDSGAMVGYYQPSSGVYQGFLRAPDGTFTAFAVPVAGTQSSQLTQAIQINGSGTILGRYTDANSVFQIFVRTADGTITTVNVPGAVDTSPFNINDSGTIVGTYHDAAHLLHGFVRTPDGTVTTLDVPAGNPSHGGTSPQCINNSGTVTGVYTDFQGMFHGFVRTPAGTVTVIDAPGAGTTANQGTNGGCINAAGQIWGSYIDAKNVQHGYLVQVPTQPPSAGQLTFTTFAGPPGSTAIQSATINNAGTIAGYYYDTSSVYHGFIRTTDGAIQRYDAPPFQETASTGIVAGTYITGINDSGDVTGDYVDSNHGTYGFVLTSSEFSGSFVSSWYDGVFPYGINNSGSIMGVYRPDWATVNQGFLRTPDNTFTTFADSGAGGQGTTPIQINGSGTIAGNYTDANNASHPFVRNADGTFATWSFLGAASTYASSINDQGAVVGNYFTPISDTSPTLAGHGFLRYPKGDSASVIITLDIPVPGANPARNATLGCINNSGTITGGYTDDTGVSHGFVYTSDGTVTTIDAPGAGTNANQGTTIGCLNVLGETVGSYTDASNAVHWFLLQL